MNKSHERYERKFQRRQHRYDSRGHRPRPSKTMSELNSGHFSAEERKAFGYGARAGKKVGFAEGINGRLFRQVSKNTRGSRAAGFRAAYSQAFIAGKEQRNLGKAARKLL